VERLRAEGAPADEDACGGRGAAADHEQALAAALAAADEFDTSASLLAAQVAETFTTVNTRKLKMCPACFAGPILNENCSDLRAHHG
jgi:hypothetical protein